MVCRFSPKAEEDLEAIGDYIAEDNPRRAVTFIREIRERCQQIAAFPKASPQRLELGAGVRMAPHRNYLIFYHEEGSDIIVDRVLHGARDYGELFE